MKKKNGADKLTAAQLEVLAAAASALIDASQLSAGVRDALVSGNGYKAGVLFAEVRAAIKMGLRHINELSGSKYFNPGGPQ